MYEMAAARQFAITLAVFVVATVLFGTVNEKS
jgi:hypothetical protein